MPFMIVSTINQDWVFGDFFCQLQGYLATVLFVTSTMTLLIVSIDRYYAIISPLKYPFMFTTYRGNIMIAFTWLAGLLVALPPLLNWGKYSYHREKLSCAIVWRSHVTTDNASEDEARGYLLFFSLSSYVFPVLGMAWCYCNIFRAAVGHSKRNRIYPTPQTEIESESVHISEEDSSDENDVPVSSKITKAKSRRISIVTTGEPVPRTGTRDCKAAKTILLIATGFLICWVPYFVVAGLEASGEIVSPILETIAIFFAYFSCVLNAGIYGYLNRVMRVEIMRLVRQVGNRGVDVTTMMDSDDYYSTTYTTLSSVRGGVNARNPQGRGVPGVSSLNRKSLTTSQMEAIVEMSEECRSELNSPKNHRNDLFLNARHKDHSHDITGVAGPVQTLDNISVHSSCTLSKGVILDPLAIDNKHKKCNSVTNIRYSTRTKVQYSKSTVDLKLNTEHRDLQEDVNIATQTPVKRSKSLIDVC